MITMEEILEVAEKIRRLDPRVQYREDPEAARAEDLEAGRGVLILNPEIGELADYAGAVVEHEGAEYRVKIDEHLRGLVDKKTDKPIAGFWVAPLPPIDERDLTPLLIDPERRDRYLHWRWWSP